MQPFQGMNPLEPSKAGDGMEAVRLERDGFLRSLLRELAGTLQDVVGLEEASGYISVVGGAIGEQIDQEYRRAINVDRLTRDQVSLVLVDLKRRIQGDFYIMRKGKTGSCWVIGPAPLVPSSRDDPLSA